MRDPKLAHILVGTIAHSSSYVAPNLLTYLQFFKTEEVLKEIYKFQKRVLINDLC